MQIISNIIPLLLYVRPIIYKFSKIRYLVNKDTALLMYKTYVLPHLEHGLYLKDNYFKGQIENLQKLQNKCLRLCFKKDWKSSAHLLHIIAKLLPLRLRKVLSSKYSQPKID